jgi:hypothetical protein
LFCFHDATVVMGTPRSRASAEAVPKRAMMSETLISRHAYDICRVKSTVPTNTVVAHRYESVHNLGVLDTDNLLRLLDERGIKNVQIARALGLPDSRVPEIKSRKRALKLDEAVKLVRAFQLEEGHEVPPLPVPIVRLLVRHVAERLRARASEELLEDVSQDIRAFGVFAADRRVRQSLEAAEGFLQALRYRRPEAEEEAPQGTDPHHAK